MLHFFRPRSGSGDPQAQQSARVESPAINENGDIDFWPDGFFDQFDKDSSCFAGWG